MQSVFPHLSADAKEVIITGLKSRPDLNGTRATVLGPADPKTGRYPIRPEKGTESILLKPSNFVDPADPPLPQRIPTCASQQSPVPTPPPPAADPPPLPPPVASSAISTAGPDEDTAPSCATPDPASVPLPASPMWAPPVIGAATSQLAWRRRGQDTLGGAEDDDEEEEGWDEEAEEAEAIDNLAVDAALLVAARRGAGAAGAAPSFAPVEPSAWRDSDAAALAETVSRCRWDGALVGGQVRACDLSTADGVAKARDAITRRLPIVMRGGASSLLLGKGLAEEALGSLASIRRHLHGREVTVLESSPDAAARFTYYFDEKAYEWSFAAPPPVNRRRTVKWDAALEAQLQAAPAIGKAPCVDADAKGPSSGCARGTSYMQLGVAARRGTAHAAVADGSGRSVDTMSSAASPELLARLQDRMAGEGLMADLAGRLGPWTTSMLYVGPPGTLAPCHWDALDNIFVQTCGVKNVLLFAADRAGMRPFPSDHPYDSRSQLDLEAADALSSAELDPLHADGGVAILQPGDALFVPNHWWHHIHSDDANDVSISLNFWFSPFEELAAPRLEAPLKPHMHPQLARAAEALVVAHLPRREQAAEEFESLCTLLESLVEGNTAAAMEPMQTRAPLAAGSKAHVLLGVRNFVVGELVAIYGRQGAARFCRAFLDPQRWKRLRRDCFRRAAAQ